MRYCYLERQTIAFALPNLHLLGVSAQRLSCARLTTLAVELGCPLLSLQGVHRGCRALYRWRSVKSWGTQKFAPPLQVIPLEPEVSFSALPMQGVVLDFEMHPPSADRRRLL